MALAQNRGQRLRDQVYNTLIGQAGQAATRVAANAARHYGRRVSTWGEKSPSFSRTRMPKRARSSGSSSSRPFKKGKDRTGGYYGRYALAVNEKKFFDGAKAKTATSATGTIFDDSLVEIPQGVTEKTRVGRVAKLHSLHMNFTIRLPPVADNGSATEVTRIIVFVDKQANGATALVADILETAVRESYRKLANSHRFYILCDKTTTLNAQWAGATLGNALTFKTISYNKHWKEPLQLEFSGVTGAITELRSNNIGVLIITDEGSSEVQYNWRVRFTD